MSYCSASVIRQNTVRTSDDVYGIVPCKLVNFIRKTCHQVNL
ncbi:Uncharacterized protein BM_BM14356, partial [Brugia malayi]